MSYILDALKKSEQERQQNNGPTLQTVQHPPMGQSHSSAVPWLLFTVALLVVSMAGFSGWYFISKTEQPIIQNIPTDNIRTISAEQKQPNETAVSNVQQAVTDTAPLSAANTHSGTSESTPIITTPEPERPILEMWELPDAVQQQLPAMTFSFHVYSDNSQRRTIIINNRRVKQGGSVVPGLLLEEITPEGIVFDWQSRYRFSINVVENW